MSTDPAARTEITHGENDFTIKVWLTGNVNKDTFTGVANVVNEYTMAGTSPYAIAASSDVAKRTQVTFDRSNRTSVPATSRNWEPGHSDGWCPADTLANQGTGPQGCKTNPFEVDAKLVVHADVPVGTTNRLVVAAYGSDQLTVSATNMDYGLVEVVEADADFCAEFLDPLAGAESRSKGFKRGSTIPVKVQITDCDGTVLGAGDDADGFGITVSLRRTASETDTVSVISTQGEGSAHFGNQMRWDEGGYYIFNLSTKKSQLSNNLDLLAGEYELTVTEASDAFEAAKIRFEVR